jgi:putative Holliday junction resolvase
VSRTFTRLLGVDYGSVRIGLAVSDPDRKLAFPLSTHERRGTEADAAFFRTLVAEEEIGALVVGLPVHLDGREGQKAVEARAFGQWLSETTGLPVTFYDERFSSVQAESALWEAGLTHRKRRQRRDKVAAQMVLQAYLDAGCPAESPPGPLES